MKYDLIHREPHPYGYCPDCGRPGVRRERRPDGNDQCQAGHTYPSRLAQHNPPKSDKKAEGMKIEKLLVEADENSRFDLNVKRLHLPFKITQDCPKCGVPCVRNLSSQFSVSVVLGVPTNLHGYCTECDHEWKMLVKVEINLIPWMEGDYEGIEAAKRKAGGNLG